MDNIKSALEKWGIPYIDLRYDTTLNVCEDDINNTYFYSDKDEYDNFILVGDKTHPNIKGYDRFYVPIIEERLISLNQ